MAFDPLNYTRRTSGESKGGGGFSEVVQYADQEERGGSHITYQPSGANEGAFRIQSDGVYAVSVTAFNGGSEDVEIGVGTALINSINTANSRATFDSPGIGSTANNVVWTGFVRAGMFIYVVNLGSPAAFPLLNQISISQVC